MLPWLLLNWITISLCFVTGNNAIAIPETRSHESIFGNLTGVDSHISIASQILESARKKLHADLGELCEKRTYDTYPADCSDIYGDVRLEDGIYKTWPRNRVIKGPINVYCDMTTDGGGWTVIQRRGDFKSPTDYFRQDWYPYKTGFGELTKDFWIGNDNLFALTNQRNYQLRVDLTDWQKNSSYATYDEFWISDESLKYILHVDGYNGTSGDALLYHNGIAFSTKDKDNDQSTKNCAEERQGAWWYKDCAHSNLNGMYLRGKISSTAYEGIHWKFFNGLQYSLKDTIMKIRPLDFDKNYTQ